jgi:hypothetical protein
MRRYTNEVALLVQINQQSFTIRYIANDAEANMLSIDYKRSSRTRSQEHERSEEVGVVSVAGGGEDVVRDDVAERAPCEDVDEVEADGVVGLEQPGVLLGAHVAGLEVRLAVLLRHLFCHVLPLEVEEDEAAQEERHTRAEADHQRRVQLRARRHGPPRRRGAE